MKPLDTIKPEEPQNLVPETIWTQINKARAQYPELSWLPEGGAHPNHIRKLIQEHLSSIQDSSAKEFVLQIAQDLRGERTWFDNLIDNQQQELSQTLATPEVSENPYATMSREDIAHAITNQSLTPDQMDMAVDALVSKTQDPEMPLTALYLVIHKERNSCDFTPSQQQKLVHAVIAHGTKNDVQTITNEVFMPYFDDDCNEIDNDNTKLFTLDEIMLLEYKISEPEKSLGEIAYHIIVNQGAYEGIQEGEPLRPVFERSQLNNLLPLLEETITDEQYNAIIQHQQKIGKPLSEPKLQLKMHN